MPHLFVRSFLLAASSALLLAGCADKRQASNATFERVAQEYYKKNGELPACLRLPEGDTVFVMFYGRDASDKDAIIVKEKSRDDLKLARLEQSGLMSREVRPTKGGMVTYRYRITEKGKPFLKDRNSLCYGMQRFKGVKNYTEPAEVLGKKISEVTMLMKSENIADWMEDKETQKLWLGDFDFKATREVKKTFVLMGDGWTMD